MIALKACACSDKSFLNFREVGALPLLMALNAIDNSTVASYSMITKTAESLISEGANAIANLSCVFPAPCTYPSHDLLLVERLVIPIMLH